MRQALHSINILIQNFKKTYIETPERIIDGSKAVSIHRFDLFLSWIFILHMCPRQSGFSGCLKCWSYSYFIGIPVMVHPSNCVVENKTITDLKLSIICYAKNLQEKNQ